MRLDTSLSKGRATVKSTQLRLHELLNDGLTDDERVAKRESLMRVVGEASYHVTTAKEQLESLGPTISEDELGGLNTTLQRLIESVTAKQRQVDLDRREIVTRSGDDLQGQVENLETELFFLEKQLAVEQCKLEGIILLHEVLSLERRRVARLIAEPLNQRIAPWLQRLRGVPTSVIFDHETGRITHVVTERSSIREELPFAEHSEGFREQIALLIRLTLARLVAQRNGSYFVILDDPLTETSPDRRPEMFRILRQAAEDLQIVLVTCHTDALDTLPQPYELMHA
jgi:DNA repair exonuclease SbcCD ATPase subunit